MYASSIFVYILFNEIVLGHLLKPSTGISPNVDYNRDIQGQLEDKVEAMMKSVNVYNENGVGNLNDDTLITGEISALIPKKNYHDTKFTKHMKESAKQQENILRAIENLYKEFQEHDHEHVHLDSITRGTTTATTLAPQTAPVYLRTNPLPGHTQPQSLPVYSPQYFHQPNLEYQQHISEDTRKYGNMQAASNVMESNPNNVYSPYAPQNPHSPSSPPGSQALPGSPCPAPCPLSQMTGYMYPPSFPPAAPAFPLASAFPPLPMVLPGRTYYEPVVHNHPPINKINEYIEKDKKDYKKWKKYRNKYKNIADSSSGSDSSSSDSDKSLIVDYYDDAILVSAH